MMTGFSKGGLEQFCFQAVPERRQWLYWCCWS